jgi:putative membrane protein
MQGSLSPNHVWAAWTFEPWFVLPLALIVLIYIVGLVTIWRRAGIGHGISKLRAASFLAAVLILIIIFMSPLDALSDILFSAHMTQHMLLIVMAAPLLIISDIPLVLLWALPKKETKRLGRGVNRLQTLARFWQGLSHPMSAGILFAITLWGWHASTLYEAALQNDTLHILEHLIFLVTAMLCWYVLLKPTEQKYRRYGLLVFYLFGTTLQSGILGALMTFASRPWYPHYAISVSDWGLTPLQDQQLAGLIMWILGGAVFTLLTIVYFAAWLRALEQRSARLQHRLS